MRTFTKALLLIDKNWEQLQQPPTAEWINKLWHIYIVGYYTADQTPA
jgi:hypothetical protein